MPKNERPGENEHFADRLMARIKLRSAGACVGLDPLVERLPESLRIRPPAEALFEYGVGVIEAVASLVPAIKINIAFFEPFHEEGWRVYRRLVAAAHDAGLIVIGDIKRADIGHSSAQYALAHLGGDDASTPDAVTVNPYFGSEGVDPFIEQARRHGRGVFVLVQTSNPSASQVQGLRLGDDSTVCHATARLVQSWAARESCLGKGGYSCVRAVVSPRDLPSTRRVRELMPDCVFLVPGFGAQGRSVDEVAECFKSDGTGAIVTASRSVIYAYEDAEFRGRDWKEAVGEACRTFVRQIQALRG